MKKDNNFGIEYFNKKSKRGPKTDKDIKKELMESRVCFAWDEEDVVL